jgi:murein DD-endopeptidase MepM/ murein hydrolase activator NlpD
MRVTPQIFLSFFLGLSAVAVAFFYQPVHRLSQPRGLGSEERARAEELLAVAEAAVQASTQQISYRIKAGDTLARIWATLGAPREGAVRASTALEVVKLSTRSLRIHDTLEFTQDSSGDILAMKQRLSDGRTLELRGDASGYKPTLTQPTIVENVRTVSGSIQSSFAEDAMNAGAPYEVIDDLVDLLGARIEFRRELQPGDTFTIMFKERRTADGMRLAAGPIQAAAIFNNGKRVAAVRYDGSDGKSRYFDDRGNLIGNYFLRYPLKFSRIASAFSNSRFHPVLKIHRPHNGVDFAAPMGTPVRSVADGIVTSAGYNGGSGKMIKISHDSRYATAYLHLARIESSLRPGMRVARGQVIGTVGMTGLATGPHLHFSLYDRGRYIDPLKSALPSLTPANAVIPASYLTKMLDTLSTEREKVLVAMQPTNRRAG